MPQEKPQHRGMPSQRKRVVTALIGSSVLYLLSQYMFWRSFNPFQHGVDVSDYERTMMLLLEEEKTEDAPQMQPSHNHIEQTQSILQQFAPHRIPDKEDVSSLKRHSQGGFPHHTNIPSDHGDKSFCLQWKPEDAMNRTLQPFDHWWVHHPTWVISKETDHMFCVEPVRDEALMQAFQRFYHTQFETGCEKIHWRMMWSSGWGADMMNVQCGLVESTNNLHIPLVVGLWNPEDDPEVREPGIWHYSANKDDHSNKTCPQADMTCYFLPYHPCGSLDYIEKNADRIEFVMNNELPEEGEIYTESGRAANAFLTRQQLWLRRAVYDFKRQFESRYESESDCTVVHVRRSDVVLHDQFSRKYFPVTDYVQLIPAYRKRDPNQTILLLTDDANAIDEAHEFHPELRWKYINRTRYKGASGGWEHQTPSNNPASEVITLLATFDLVKECSLLVHGASKFSEMLWFMMKGANNEASQRRVDANKEIYSNNHSASEFELNKRLNAMRQRTNNTDSSEVARISNLDNNATTSPEGLIIVNILGLLANDLFEAAFAARMKEQLGWAVVYRTMWNPAWPTAKTDQCFPNVKREIVGEDEEYGPSNPLWNFLLKHGGGRINDDVQKLYEAVTFNAIEPNGDIVLDQHDANEVHIDWINEIGDKAKVIKHMEYPLQEFHVDSLVEQLKNPHSTVRVLQLEAFFIHFDWMRDWMGPMHIPRWLKINQNKKCCPSPPPERNTIVIHIRDFNPEDDDKNKNLQVGVFRDIIHKYYDDKSNDVWVVCQPKSVKSEIVQDLVEEFDAKVHTGTDNIDAFCILARARIHIPTTSSSFSEMAALLAESNVKERYGNDTQVEVHYPTHTLEYPMVTLKVPNWKYHLTDEECTGIKEFDVDQARLLVTQA